MGAQLRNHLTWAPINSASKYVEELCSIKRDAQLSRGRIKRAHVVTLICIFLECTLIVTLC